MSETDGMLRWAGVAGICTLFMFAAYTTVDLFQYLGIWNTNSAIANVVWFLTTVLGNLAYGAMLFGFVRLGEKFHIFWLPIVAKISIGEISFEILGLLLLFSPFGQILYPIAFLLGILHCSLVCGLGILIIQIRGTLKGVAAATGISALAAGGVAFATLTSIGVISDFLTLCFVALATILLLQAASL